MGAASAKTGPQWGRRGLDLCSRLEQRAYVPYVMRISMRSEHAAEWSAYRVSRLHAAPFVALDLPSTFGDREESGNTQASLGVLKLITFIITCCSFTGGLLILNLSSAVCVRSTLSARLRPLYFIILIFLYTNKMRKNYLFRYLLTHDHIVIILYCLRVNHRIELRMHLFDLSMHFPMDINVRCTENIVWLSFVQNRISMFAIRSIEHVVLLLFWISSIRGGHVGTMVITRWAIRAMHFSAWGRCL